MIKKIKKRIAKGLEITEIKRDFYSKFNESIGVYFSDGSYVSADFTAEKAIKKLDKFLYLTERALERKAKESSKQQVDICSYCHEIEFKESACFLARQQKIEERRKNKAVIVNSKNEQLIIQEVESTGGLAFVVTKPTQVSEILISKQDKTKVAEWLNSK
jgi:excinuclease UvrABC nuclease subunit